MEKHTKGGERESASAERAVGVDARMQSVLTMCAWRQPALGMHTCVQPVFNRSTRMQLVLNVHTHPEPELSLQTLEAKTSCTENVDTNGHVGRSAVTGHGSFLRSRC